MILSEAGNTTKSMVSWLNLARMNDHSGANLGRDFAMNMPYGDVETYF